MSEDIQLHRTGMKFRRSFDDILNSTKIASLFYSYSTPIIVGVRHHCWLSNSQITFPKQHVAKNKPRLSKYGEWHNLAHDHTLETGHVAFLGGNLEVRVDDAANNVSFDY